MEAEHSEFITLQGLYDQLQDDYLRLQEDYVRLRAETDVIGVLPDPPVSISKLPLLRINARASVWTRARAGASVRTRIRIRYGSEKHSKGTGVH